MGGVGRALTLAGSRVLPQRVRHALARTPGFMRAHEALQRRGGFTVVRVAEGPLAGARLEIDPTSEREYWAGNYELATQTLLAELPIDGIVAWDVGAHVGFLSLLLARRAERVVAVEAAPENVERLRRNVRLNGAEVAVVAAAAGRARGKTRVVVAGRMSHVSDVEETGVEVERLTLDDLARQYGMPRFVKVDVEGAELDVLAGADEVLAAGPIVLVEAHSQALGDAVTRVLEQRGYAVTEDVRSRADGQLRLIAHPSAASSGDA
jgi:FkbM family methyltransferase